MRNSEYRANKDLADTPKRRINQDIYPPVRIDSVMLLHGLFWVCVLGVLIGTAFKIWG